MPFDPKKLQTFIKAGGKTGQGAQTGGKGSIRRKRKIVRKQTAHDDKRLKSTLNKLNVRDIPAIEEVNLFKDDGTVIHFASPKVQASIASNTYVVSGNAETKKLQELLPGIINQLGPDNLEDLKKIYASYTPAAGKAAEDDDDDIPELVGNFEEQSKPQEKAPEKEKEKGKEQDDKEKTGSKDGKDKKKDDEVPAKAKEVAPKAKEASKEKAKPKEQVKSSKKDEEEEDEEEEDEEEEDEAPKAKEVTPAKTKEASIEKAKPKEKEKEKEKAKPSKKEEVDEEGEEADEEGEEADEEEKED